MTEHDEYSSKGDRIARQNGSVTSVLSRAANIRVLAILSLLILSGTSVLLFDDILPGTPYVEPVPGPEPFAGWRSCKNASYIIIAADPKRTENDNVECGIQAGEELFIIVTIYDRFDEVCTDAGYDVVLYPASYMTDRSYPEPWKSLGNTTIRLPVENGTAGNPDDLPIIFHRGDIAQIHACLFDDPTISSSLSLRIIPAGLSCLESEPEEAVLGPGESLRFSVTGKDMYGNPVPMNRTVWWSDGNISKNGQTTMCGDGTFTSMEAPPLKGVRGHIHAELYSNAGERMEIHIPVSVECRWDIWIIEDEVEPSHVLIGQNLSLSIPVHYDIPGYLVPDDNIDLDITISISNETGSEIVTLLTDTMTIDGFSTRSKGVKTFQADVPSPAFMEYLRYTGRERHGAYKNFNYMKVEITEKGEGDVFVEISNRSENDVVITELYAIVPPPIPNPSFSPSILSVLIALAIVSLFGIKRGDRSFLFQRPLRPTKGLLGRVRATLPVRLRSLRETRSR